MPLRSPPLSKFALLFTTVFVISAVMHSERADNLVVTVRDIRNKECGIRIALYSSSDNFLVDGRTVATQSMSARPGNVRVVFADLRPGNSAAEAFHDENRSGDFDADFIGVPREDLDFLMVQRLCSARWTLKKHRSNWSAALLKTIWR